MDTPKVISDDNRTAATVAPDPSKKTRYLLGPYEDGDPVALMTLDEAVDILKESFACGFPGDDYTFRIVELTEAEVGALPEL